MFGTLNRTASVMRNFRAYCWFLTPLLFLSCAGPAVLAVENSADRVPPREIRIAGQPSAASRESERSKHVEGRVLIQFNDGTTKEEMETILREVHLEVIRALSRPNLYLMKIRDNTDVKTVLERLKGYPAVKHAEPDFIITID